MTQDELKKAAALAALEYIKPNNIIGVGTGSTINYFIEGLATIKKDIQGVVSSSNASTAKLKSCGIEVYDSNHIDKLAIYVDGADEINEKMQMIKGGGGALTREKVIAALADTFICIIDASKQVEALGQHFPLPVEVIPMARNYVAREIKKMGGHPIYRQNFFTDNSNIIIDIHHLLIKDAIAVENKINNIAGVVSVGLFANRGADIALVATESGVKKLQSSIKRN